MLEWLVPGHQLGFALSLRGVASGGDLVAPMCYVTADTPQGSGLGVLIHRTWHNTHLLCGTLPSSAAGVFWGSGFRLEVSVVLKVGWVCGCLGMIEPGLQHRCGTGWSSCLQQLVCEPGPREVNQPQGRAQGA